MGLLDFLLKDTIGLDPGSRYLRIIKDGNLIFNEETQISIDKVASVVSGIGGSVGKTEKDVTLRPVNYAIADFQAFEMLLRAAIKKSETTKVLRSLSKVVPHVLLYSHGNHRG